MRKRIDSNRKRSAPSKANAARPRPAEDRRARVVIADDDPAILDRLGQILEAHFNVVGRLHNGRELIDGVRRFVPAVVVADITMPEINGIESAREITRAYP